MTAGDSPSPPDLDGMIVAAGSHRVLPDTPAVRVFEVVIDPRSREPEHTHRNRSVMIVGRAGSDSLLRAPRSDIRATARPRPGAASRRWMDSEGPHSIENIDTTQLSRLPRRDPGLTQAPGQRTSTDSV
jgi:hypothetical protein